MYKKFDQEGDPEIGLNSNGDDLSFIVSARLTFGGSSLATSFLMLAYHYDNEHIASLAAAMGMATIPAALNMVRASLKGCIEDAPQIRSEHVRGD